jgi:hypothetical protein
MSDAKKILNERLAKGEISSEEYEKISVLVDSNEKPAVDLNEVKVGVKKAGSAVWIKDFWIYIFRSGCNWLY